MLTTLLFTGLALNAANTPFDKIEDYDVVWSTPSVDSAGSMPIGNGEVVLNVWVDDATGDVLFLIGRSDSLSEISRILKLGRVRIHLSPSPFRGASDFRQRLDLRNGAIELQGGGEKLRLFVDSYADVIHLEGTFARERRVVATCESWRTAERPLPRGEMVSAWSVHDAPFPLVESADRFAADSGDTVTWFHRNETTVVPQVLALQSLTGRPGAFDPIIHRTFGGSLSAPGLKRLDSHSVGGDRQTKLDVTVATHCRQTDSEGVWRGELKAEAAKSPTVKAAKLTKAWWNAFWGRSWVLANGDAAGDVPQNDFPLRKGVDSEGASAFPGAILDWIALEGCLSEREMSDVFLSHSAPTGRAFEGGKNGFTLWAKIRPDKVASGRIFDKLTAGRDDGFLFDNHPGDGLRLIVGSTVLTAEHCLTIGKEQAVAATYDAARGEAVIWIDGAVVARREPAKGSAVTRSFLLQRFVQACHGRGNLPIKFNGGTLTVEPKPMGLDTNADYRSWGDCFWYQNTRHPYIPMVATGDFEMMEPFFRLYESARPIAESRTKLYHGCEGTYFPETMTLWGTYSGGDYGWDRTGKQPKDVNSPWWQYAWNQGPELLSIMLDRWDYTRDEAFLKNRVLPMAVTILKYFDTRFEKDSDGRIVLDPTQAVETYWHSVTNDMPTTAGLISVSERLCALPSALVSTGDHAFFERIRKACPLLPLRDTKEGKALAPAQKYADEVSNCENPELYAVWPFRVVSLAHPKLAAEAALAYKLRLNHLDVGWGYDGNVAALLGMTDEAARILRAKCANSHPSYRWPASWGPNFDWIPDQDHGSNLLNTTNLMLLQAEPLEAGGAIRVLPAWPRTWSVDFKLHAPGKTTVRCVASEGVITKIEVTPASRRKDVIVPEGWRLQS